MDARALLKSPLIYMTFQTLAGGVYARDFCLNVLDIQSGERVLDIGCGPAYYLSKMPRVEYYGFDTDSRYIEYARARFSQHGQFFCEAFSKERSQSLGQFDCVMLMGLLHHLDDTSSQKLLKLIASILTPKGRVVALDVAVHDEQRRFDHFLAINDRGKFVRRPEDFTLLARPFFGSVIGSHIKAWWIPSIHWYMTLREPCILDNQSKG